MMGQINPGGNHRLDSVTVQHLDDKNKQIPSQIW